MGLRYSGIARRNHARSIKGLINWQDREVTKMIQSAPIEVVILMASLRPALSNLNNYQRRYGSQQLAALVIQPTGDILSASLRDGDEETQ